MALTPAKDRRREVEAIRMAPHSTVRDLVLDAIANDYEDFEMILCEVARWAAEDQRTISEAEIADGLLTLINDGLAAAYHMSEKGAQQIEVSPSTLRAQDNYFFRTAVGKRILDSRAGD